MSDLTAESLPSPKVTQAPALPAAKPIDSYKPFWAARFGTAPFLPMSRAEMDKLGWDSCDIIVVTGDAYVDHPSFGMSVIGRMLEAQGFRVGIIAQPDWQSADPFRVLGKPNLFFGVTAGNMDSMINRYTADRKIRSDDAYTPGDVGGKRPDRAAIVYSQRCREAYKDVPIVLGGIEGSLRRIAHYDYWSDKVRRSIVVDAKCDLLLYGNAERAIVEVAHRLAAREPVEKITDVRGTAFIRRSGDESSEGWFEIDSTRIDTPGRVEAHVNPYLMISDQAREQGATCAREDEAQAVASEAEAKAMPRGGAGAGAGAPAQADVRPLNFVPNPALQGRIKVPPRERSVIRLPSYEQVKSDPVLYAHANRVLHLETNPGNARALVQAHGAGVTARDVWINPPPIPLTTAEMDLVFDLPYARSPHPAYADENGSHDGATKIPAWEMIRFSVNIMRGCFGGCTFCSITEHEGRIIQSRSEPSILREIEHIRAKTKGAKGLDDFARTFMRGRDGDWGTSTYDFNDVVAALNGVVAYDWANLLTQRLTETAKGAPLNGFTKGGYRLTYGETPTGAVKDAERTGESVDLVYSLGLSVGKSGKINQVIWDSPAFDKGMTVDDEIVAVNNRAYSGDGIRTAITGAKDGKSPVRLLVKSGDRYRDVTIDYRGGLRYPRFEKIGAGEGSLDKLLSPRS